MPFRAVAFVILTTNNKYLNLMSKHYSYFSLFFEKGMTGRVPVKGNCVDSGPSLVAEPLT